VNSQGPLEAAAAASGVPHIPSGSDGVVFAEPWEAQAFAITVALHERGLFSWPEWTSALAAEMQAAQERGDPDTGDTYYHHWLAALERLVVAKHATDATTIARYRQAWERAARRTPHGTPIELAPKDFREP
jgi:nitrile hydratase accessory protein